MAEDNAVSPNVGLLYGLDENINPFNGTNLVPCSSEKEDNQNIFISHTDSVSIIEKLSEFTNRSSYKNKNFDPANISLFESRISNNASCNAASSVFSVHCNTDPNEIENAANPIPSTSILNQEDIGNEHFMPAFSDCRKAELIHDSLPNKTVPDSGEIKQALTFENHSEAGPDVAEFSEEELRSVAELFKEPSAYDFFQKASNSQLLRESPLGRLSLFVKLDSAYKSGLEGSQERSAQDSGLDISGDSNSLNAACGNDKDYEDVQPGSIMTSETSAVAFDNSNIDINSISMKKMEKTSSSHQQSSLVQEHKLFTEEEFTQALKMQELLFHEKQLKRDKERGEQVKVVEREKQMLKNQIVALSKGYRASRSVLEELLNIFTLWLSAKEQERVEMTSGNQKAVKERDQALEDLQNVESAFADLHRRYENCKSVLEGYKQNEERIKLQVSEMQVKLKQQEQMYEMLRSRIQDKLDSANAEIESAKKSGDVEVTVLRAQMKKAEMKISSLEKDLEQKNKENVELGSICDDLIAKVGKT